MTRGETPDPGTEEFLAWLETVPDTEQPAAVRDAMDDLQARLRRVAETRSALMRRDYSGSYDELAQGYGVSRQRAHQIVAAGLSYASPRSVRRTKKQAPGPEGEGSDKPKKTTRRKRRSN
jgi:DNA-directed RNA polymerase sigma subunit (sigma70/sigma32)